VSRVAAFNERFAVLATRAFGTVWAFYVLTVYGLMPLLFPAAIDRLLYWSNVIQLVALPLLAVGQAVLGRAGERQAKETHDTVMEDRELLLQELAEEREMRQQLAEVLARLAPEAS
jgi:hypothetical protein